MTATNNERVIGISLMAEGVQAQVISTGCTSAEDFEISHVATQSACKLTLVRIKPDYCRRAPFVVEVSVPWSAPVDCQDLPVEFTNEIVRQPEKSAVSSKQLPDKKQ